MMKTKYDSFNAYMLRGAGFTEKWEMPIIESVPLCIPEDLVLFSEMRKAKNCDAWVHFYTDDRRFRSIWTSPTKHLSQLRRFKGVISPDFSVYNDMPKALQIYGVFQNRAVAYWLSVQGVPVIPNVRWGDERSYEFCFDGLPANSVVAVGTNGCLRNSDDRELFRLGLDEMCRRLTPQHVLVYGPAPEDLFRKHIEAGINIVPYPAEMRRVHERKEKVGES